MKYTKSIVEEAWRQTKDEVPEAFRPMDRRTRRGKHLRQLAEQEFLAYVEEFAERWFSERLRAIRKRR